MFASMVLSVFILGIGGFSYSASSRASDLVLKQKALFALNAEVERLTGLYNYTSFATDLLNAPATTTGYDGIAAIPTTRLTYPGNVGSFASSNYVTASAATFASSEFYVLLSSNLLPSLNRSYVWIDKARNIVGRISWVAKDINIPSCISDDCFCRQYGGLSLGDHCKAMDIYLEYPYRFDPSSGNIAAPSTLKTLSLKTIVGRGE